MSEFYRDTLGREPDPVGVAFWVDQIRTGRRTVAQVASQIYASPEYYRGLGGGTDAAWVADLYRALLHRVPDDPGLAYWVRRTASHGRDDVAAAFFDSVESRRDRVDVLYQSLLGRPADESGRTYWARRLVAEGDLTLAVHLVSSAEYDTRADARFP